MNNQVQTGWLTYSYQDHHYVYDDKLTPDVMILFLANPGSISESTGCSIAVNSVPGHDQPVYGDIGDMEFSVSFTIQAWNEAFYKRNLKPKGVAVNNLRDYVNEIIKLKEPLQLKTNKKLYNKNNRKDPSLPFVCFYFNDNFYYKGYIRNVGVDYKWFDVNKTPSNVLLSISMLVVKPQKGIMNEHYSSQKAIRRMPITIS